jgi:hypothetical protein
MEDKTILSKKYVIEKLNNVVCFIPVDKLISEILKTNRNT